MLISLLNMSLIWLLSLLVYEFLLKKETFHRLNRLYLLLTFIAGIVLPLLPWGAAVHVTETKTTMTGVPLVLANPVPKIVDTADKAPLLPQQWPDWWQSLYLTGVAASVLYLLRGLWRLSSLYRKAVVTRSGRWRIAETGASHSPFSFLHILFVCSRDQYTDQQWQMLVQHEQQHYHQRHILDLVLLQLVQVLFWFHPLVYIYRNKLRLLHEYEVDSTQADDVQTYGRFLLEQAAFKPAPALAHSLNYSPLKNRIHMMTRNMSGTKAKYRLLLVLPMVAGFVYCCAANKDKTDIRVNGNYFSRKDVQLSYPDSAPSDTVWIEDSETLERKMLTYTAEVQPKKLNGQDIVAASALAAEPLCKQTGRPFDIRYIISKANLEKLLCTLPDGNYGLALSKTIVATDGRVVYYHLEYPKAANGGSLSIKNGKLLEERIAKALIGARITFTPAQLNGQAVPYYLQDKNSPVRHYTMFTVKDHKISYHNIP